jgi:hypothetical protein
MFFVEYKMFIDFIFDHHIDAVVRKLIGVEG